MCTRGDSILSTRYSKYIKWSIPSYTYPGNQSIGASSNGEYLVPEPILSSRTFSWWIYIHFIYTIIMVDHTWVCIRTAVLYQSYIDMMDIWVIERSSIFIRRFIYVLLNTGIWWFISTGECDTLWSHISRIKHQVNVFLCVQWHMDSSWFALQLFIYWIRYPLLVYQTFPLPPPWTHCTLMQIPSGQSSCCCKPKSPCWSGAPQ